MADYEPSPQPLLRVVGRVADDSGADGTSEVVRFDLAHGELPDAGLRSRGWRVVQATDATGTASPHTVTMGFLVEPADGPAPAPQPDPREDPDLVVAPGEVAVPYQRLAAYAVVLSHRGVLLSRFSGTTNAEGEWGPVGGGVDPGELPEEAVHREVWEESGQRIEVTGLAAVTSNHWLGRGPSGRLEDFQAVRLVFRATCEDPVDAVVHEVGGTTAEAAWVPVADLGRYPLTRSWVDLLPELLGSS